MAEKATKAKIKEIQLLLREKKERDKKGLFVAEGVKAVNDMHKKGCLPEYLLTAGGAVPEREKEMIVGELETEGVVVLETGKKEFDKISSLQTSQGILGVFRKREQPSIEPLMSGRKLVVLCDGIQDPGNLGAIFRTSAALGADAIILAGEGVDMYNPKVVRASSGTILDVPVFDHTDDLAEALKSAGYKLFASTVEAGSRPVNEIKRVPEKLIAAFGSEGHGISRRILSKSNGSFHIPMKENVESLNVAIAVGISLFVFRGLPTE